MPIKPDLCIVEGKIAIFLGADYKLISIEQAREFAGKLQSLIAHHKREERRQRRIKGE